MKKKPKAGVKISSKEGKNSDIWDTIYVILNTKGGKEGNLTWVVEAFKKQEHAERFVKKHGNHLVWVDCPLDIKSHQISSNRK